VCRSWLSFPLSPRAGNEYQAEVTNRKGLLAWYERVGQSNGVSAAAASIGATTETATKVLLFLYFCLFLFFAFAVNADGFTILADKIRRKTGLN
jgi:hypothetical protein